MSLDEEVSRSELFELVKYFSKYPFRARDTNTKVRMSNSSCCVVTYFYSVNFVT